MNRPPAKSSLIGQARALLRRHGAIASEQAAPYRRALEEVLEREDDLWSVAAQARDGLERLQARLAALNSICREHLAELRAIRDSLATRLEALERGAARAGAQVVLAALSAARVRDERPRKRLYVVPGPKDIQ